MLFPFIVRIMEIAKLCNTLGLKEFCPGRTSCRVPAGDSPAVCTTQEREKKHSY